MENKTDELLEEYYRNTKNSKKEVEESINKANEFLDKILERISIHDLEKSFIILKSNFVTEIAKRDLIIKSLEKNISRIKEKK